MNCTTAQSLIDLKVHHAGGPLPAGHDFAALDRHVAGCAACRAELAALLETRALLRNAGDENPTSEELTSMWTAIDAAAFVTPSRPSTWFSGHRATAGHVAACIGAAALLLVAQQLGQVRYEGRSSVVSVLLPSLQSVSRPVARYRLAEVDAKLAVPASPGPDEFTEGITATAEKYAYAAAAPAADKSVVEGQRFGRFAAGYESNESADRESLGTTAVGFLADVDGESYASAERGFVSGSVRADRVDLSWNFGESTPTGSDDIATGTTAGVFAGRGVEAYADAGGADGESPNGNVFYAFKTTDPIQEGVSLGLPTLQPDQAGKAVLRVEPAASSAPDSAGFEYRYLATLGDEAGGTMSDPSVVSAGQSLTLFDIGGDIVVQDAQGPGEVSQSERNRGDLQLAQATSERGAPPAPPPAPGAAPAPASRPENRPKVIKTAEITMEVPEYAPAVTMARRIVEELGGFVADGSTAELSGGALSGRVVARMPPERFDAIYNALKTVGRVEKEDARSADVTAEYVDLAARIESALITEARLQKLIEEKSFLDEVTALLEVERELQRVRTQIEQMQGSLRVMDNRIALSTITVFLHEPPRTVPAATLYIEVPTVEAGAEGVQRLLAEVGGRMTKGEIKKSENGTLLGSYGLTVTLDRFPALLAGLRALGRVAVSNVTGFKESDAAASWAAKVSCAITLDLFERARQLPSGVMTIEVDVAAEALARLEPMLPEHRASIITSTTQRRGDGSHEKEMKIRTPAASFGALIRALESDSELGRVIVKNTAGEIGEITGGAAEVLCELTLTLAEKTRQLPTGTMRIEVASTSEALRALDAILAASRASIVSNVTRRRDDGSSEAELKLSVPAGRYADLLIGLSAEDALGRTLDKNTSGEVGVITGGAAETLCELKLTLAERIKQVPAGKMVLEVEKFDPARQKLSALVAEKKLQVLAAGSDQRTDGTWIGGFRLGIRAADMDAVVSRLEGLGLVRSRQISGLNLGDLTTIDPATVGVIEVTLAEKAALAPPTEKAGGAFRKRVREALEGLWESLGMIAYGLIVMLPWLVIGGAVVWLVVRARRRAREAAVVVPAARPK